VRKVGDFLKRFKNLMPPDRPARKACRSAVKKICGVELSDGDVVVRGKVVFLLTKAVVKSEVMLHKEEVLIHLNKTLGGNQAIEDIR